ncbi:MAG: hypothetical protein U0R70_01815 [Solirubrobacteraceae bacterium]
MDFSALRRGEYIAMVGGFLLAVGVFLPCYSTSGLGSIDGARGDLSYFDVHDITRWLLLAGATAPFILAYIVARHNKLSWPRGEMTMVVSIAALGFLLYNCLINKPGDVPSLVSLAFGFFVMVLGAGMMLFGSLWRSSAEGERPRKPPGTI